MDTYVVGNVADLISNKIKLDVKPKKRKIKEKDEDKALKIERKSDEVSRKSSKSNVKEDTESELDNNKKPTVETSVKNKKSSKEISSLLKRTTFQDVETESETKSKKRKKFVEPVLDAKETDDAPKSKKQKKDSMDLDQNLSFSQAQETKIEGKSKQGIKGPPKQMSPEDFNKNTVFVGNIPISYDRKKVCKIFAQYGEIQSARIRCVPIPEINMNKKVAAIKKKFNPKRNSLVAYVKFKSEDSAKNALQANGMLVDGHHLRVDTAEENKERDNSKAIFVGGLPFDVEDDDLWEFFKNCGKIESVRVIRDSHTSMGKGFGYVNFDSLAAVELALELNGQELKKRVINIKRCRNVKNKNKSNSFDRKKSEKMTNELLSKKGKKFKMEKNKLKKETKLSNNFQGRTANMKHKKKKKLSKTVLRQRKLVKVLGKS